LILKNALSGHFLFIAFFSFVLKQKERKNSRKGYRQPHKQAIPPLPFLAHAPQGINVLPKKRNANNVFNSGLSNFVQSGHYHSFVGSTIERYESI
jgi:hypothetical protein